MSEYRFHGHERFTVELDGWFDPDGVRIPRRLSFDRDTDGRGRVQLFCFAVEDLRIAGVPLVRSSYAEVLWRIAVRDGELAAWWVIACDLEALGPRVLARRYVRYPVRRARVVVDTSDVRSEPAAGELALRIDEASRVERVAEQRTLLVGDERIWRVPWGDGGPPGHEARVEVVMDSLSRATLGAPVTWARSALVRTGREHRCGVALARE